MPVYVDYPNASSFLGCFDINYPLLFLLRSKKKAKIAWKGTQRATSFLPPSLSFPLLAFTKIPLRSLNGSFFSLSSSSSRIILSFIIIIIIAIIIPSIHALSQSSSSLPLYPLSYTILRYKELLLLLLSVHSTIAHCGDIGIDVSIPPFCIRLYETTPSCHGEATWSPGTVSP